VLCRIGDCANIELARQLVQAHAYWRLKGLTVDLVIWNEDRAGYRQLLQEQILDLIAAGVESMWSMHRPGGIFVRAGRSALGGRSHPVPDCCARHAQRQPGRNAGRAGQPPRSAAGAGCGARPGTALARAGAGRGRSAAR
jgi:hypothetical protein